MGKILVTGGCGYIGSHTIVDLIENGYSQVINVDDNSRSSSDVLKGIESITGKAIKNYKQDLKDYSGLVKIFEENEDIEAIIHFAAYKSVEESVYNPLLYYENNIVSLINVLKCADKFNVPYFVFSSSCTVYGNPDELPVTEESKTKIPESPYGSTKQIAERIIIDFCSDKLKCVLLRYFNPVGAHPSIQIGESPLGKPQNLVPIITQTATGKIEKMKVYGDDYLTKDGTCVRDYIHVSDISHAHTLSINYLRTSDSKFEFFNLGSGNGISVMEMIHSFEKISGVKLNYEIGPRRKGDVESIYANNTKAKELLGWNPRYSLDQMMSTAWEWEKKQEYEKMDL